MGNKATVFLPNGSVLTRAETVAEVRAPLPNPACMVPSDTRGVMNSRFLGKMITIRIGSPARTTLFRFSVGFQMAVLFTVSSKCVFCRNSE